MKSKKQKDKRLENIDQVFKKNKAKISVSNEKIIKDDPILSGVSDSVRDTIISFKNKGYDNNQVAALLQISKHIVENIK